MVYAVNEGSYDILSAMKRVSRLPSWKRILMIAGLVCLLPLMPEILLLLDVVGLETTVAFLLLYGQTIVQDLANRASYAYYLVESKLQANFLFNPLREFLSA